MILSESRRHRLRYKANNNSPNILVRSQYLLAAGGHHIGKLGGTSIFIAFYQPTICFSHDVYLICQRYTSGVLRMSRTSSTLRKGDGGVSNIHFPHPPNQSIYLNSGFKSPSSVFS